MNRPPSFWACRHDQAIGGTFSLEAFVAAPVLVKRAEPAVNAGALKAVVRQRSKIWEFNGSLHCSIIGTCLSTGELRQVLGKLGLAPADATDHDLHGTAVTLAGRHEPGTKLLNKALDQRHRLVINQFSRARTEAELRELWRAAVRRGDIPGAYWATLTHPACGPALIREAFGEVHMLSHLVGAANRADIRRLRDLEAELAARQAALARQQLAFRQAVIERDARIRELEQVVLERIRANNVTDAQADGDSFGKLVVSLETRLSAEAGRRAAAEDRLAKMSSALEEERAARRAADDARRVLAAELNALETTTIDAGQAASDRQASDRRMDGRTLLYVGGRAGQIAHLRQAAEHLGATFLHHDGGREQHLDLLAGLVSRADLVLFPVDCISHDAALNIKRLCRLAQKNYVPLRAASLACLLLALQLAAADGAGFGAPCRSDAAVVG